MSASDMGGAMRDQDPDDERESNLVRAINHRVRRRILRFVQASGDPCSPASVADALDVPLSSIAYHVKVLANFETVKEVGEQQVRGGTEHLYVSTVEDDPAIQAMLEQTRESDEA